MTNMVGWIKLKRSPETKELLGDHAAYILLTHICLRTKRTDDFSIAGLEPGESLIGDYEKMGLTRGQYRGAIQRLETWGFITIRPTNKGTVVKLINSSVFDVNIASDNQQTNHPLTTEEPTTNHQGTTNKNIKNSNNGKEVKFSSDSEEIRLSQLLFSLIQENNPKAKKPNIQTWAKHIDLAMRLDNRTPEELERVIRWCQADNFWHKVILSTEKLRNKFDQLWLQMEGRDKNKGGIRDDFTGKEYTGTDCSQVVWLEESREREDL